MKVLLATLVAIGVPVMFLSMLQRKRDLCAQYTSCASCTGSRYYHQYRGNYRSLIFQLKQRHPSCMWSPTSNGHLCASADSSRTSKNKFHTNNDEHIYYEYQCPLSPPYSETPPFLPDWMSRLIEIQISPEVTFSSTMTLADLSLPGSHDSMTYDLGFTISKSGIDDHDILSKWLRRWSKIFPPSSGSMEGELEEFIRLQAKTQQLDVVQQLDNGIRFFDFRIMMESDIDRMSTASDTFQWYCIHCMHSNKLALSYLKSIQEWLVYHPREFVVIWISREGSTTDTGDMAYTNVPIEAKKQFWKQYVEIFEDQDVTASGNMLFDTTISDYRTTTLESLLERGHRVVTFLSDFEEFTAGDSNSKYAYDAAVSVENYFDGDGVFEETTTMKKQREYLFHGKDSTANAKWFKLMSMNTSGNSWQVEYAARHRFLPITKELPSMEWFDSCSKKVNIPMNKFCPGALLDVSQLANYYNQIILEEAYSAYLNQHPLRNYDRDDEERSRTGSQDVSFPHAFYMDAIDYNGTIRTGTKLLFGLEYQNSLDEFKLARYAFVDTIIGYNINNACSRSNRINVQDKQVDRYLNEMGASCEDMASFVEGRRSLYPMTLWNEEYYGRLTDWPRMREPNKPN